MCISREHLFKDLYGFIQTSVKNKRQFNLSSGCLCSNMGGSNKESQRHKCLQRKRTQAKIKNQSQWFQQQRPVIWGSGRRLTSKLGPNCVFSFMVTPGQHWQEKPHALILLKRSNERVRSLQIPLNPCPLTPPPPRSDTMIPRDDIVLR